MADEKDGAWRTVGGRRVFIKTGQSLDEAMIESGKFPSGKTGLTKSLADDTIDTGGDKVNVLKEAESRIARNDYETAVIFDENGNIVFEVSQKEKCEVSLTSEQWAQAKGNILTHNHPYDEYMEKLGFKTTSALSSSDLQNAWKYELEEVRMVIGNERHSFKWNEQKTEKSVMFLISLRQKEAEWNGIISEKEKSVDTAIKRLEKSPTYDNKNKAEKAINDYYSTIQKETNKINQYISENQSAGYSFTKEDFHE